MLAKEDRSCSQLLQPYAAEHHPRSQKEQVPDHARKATDSAEGALN